MHDVQAVIGRSPFARRRLIWLLLAVLAVVQAGVWLAAGDVVLQPGVVVLSAAGWLVAIALAALASRRIGALTDRLTAREHEHRATLDEVAQLQTQNAMLEIVARSVDVPLTFQALAHRIAGLIPCERVGLALLSDNGQEFETYTARVHDDQRRTRPRPDVVFNIERTGIGIVVRSLEPMVVDDLQEVAAEYLDANVLYTAGFRSALVVPLVSSGRAVGTLNLVSREKGAFTAEHATILHPIGEILAVAHVAQRLHILLARYSTIETMADVTLSIAAEINSALQTIIGHCDLLERGYPDPNLQRDLATVVRQAQRISELLDKMRAAANERLREVTHTMEAAGIAPGAEARDLKNEVL